MPNTSLCVSISPVGFGVEAKKLYFRCRSLEMKASCSERSGRRPGQDLDRIPEGRLNNIFKGWEHTARGQLGKAVGLSNCILTLWVKQGSTGLSLGHIQGTWLQDP